MDTPLISHIGSTVLLTLFLILLLGIAVCAILSFVPKRPYLDRSSGLIVQPFLMLSSPLRFPLSRIFRSRTCPKASWNTSRSSTTDA